MNRMLHNRHCAKAILSWKQGFLADFRAGQRYARLEELFMTLDQDGKAYLAEDEFVRIGEALGNQQGPTATPGSYPVREATLTKLRSPRSPRNSPRASGIKPPKGLLGSPTMSPAKLGADAGRHSPEINPPSTPEQRRVAQSFTQEMEFPLLNHQLFAQLDADKVESDHEPRTSL